MEVVEGNKWFPKTVHSRPLFFSEPVCSLLGITWGERGRRAAGQGARKIQFNTV